MAVSDRRALVEFVGLAAIVLMSMAALVILALAGIDDDYAVIGVLSDLIKVLVGALVALAYAARGMPGAGRRDDRSGGARPPKDEERNRGW